jgi:hypothetical protein
VVLKKLVLRCSDLRKRSYPDACAAAEPQGEKNDDRPAATPAPAQAAGPFAPEISSFRLHLAVGDAPRAEHPLQRAPRRAATSRIMRPPLRRLASADELWLLPSALLLRRHFQDVFSMAFPWRWTVAKRHGRS